MKNPKKISKDKNEDNIKNKLIKNGKVRNEMKKKRGMPRNIIQGNRLQEPIVRRGRSRKEINELPENDKKCLTESEDESYSHSDFVVDQRPEENKKKIHS